MPTQLESSFIVHGHGDLVGIWMWVGKAMHRVHMYPVPGIGLSVHRVMLGTSDRELS